MDRGHSGKGGRVGLVELTEADVECVLRGGFHRVAIDAGGDQITNDRGVWFSLGVI